MEWGFTISRPRAVDLDKNDMGYSKRLLREHPELQTCIACGNCTATCTAGALVKFNVLQASDARPPRRIPGRSRRAGQVHAMRQVPSGMSPRHQYPATGPDAEEGTGRTVGLDETSAAGATEAVFPTVRTAPNRNKPSCRGYQARPMCRRPQPEQALRRRKTRKEDRCKTENIRPGKIRQTQRRRPQAPTRKIETMEHFRLFVLPFWLGALFLLVALLYKYILWFVKLEPAQRRMFFRSLPTRATLRSLGEIASESLLHRKIWRRNKLLGYMHTSFALGWFLLIVVGWTETLVYFKGENVPLYVDIFFSYYVHPIFEHNFNFSLIKDALLLLILVGVGLAWFKRIRSRADGHATHDEARTRRPASRCRRCG